MRLNALVMSRSHSSVKALVAAFAELGIEYRISMSASETIETLSRPGITRHWWLTSIFRTRCR
jgi:hypothetical protein